MAVRRQAPVMAQQLGAADLLEREGVTAVFGITGEENIGFVDARAGR